MPECDKNAAKGTQTKIVLVVRSYTISLSAATTARCFATLAAEANPIWVAWPATEEVERRVMNKVPNGLADRPVPAFVDFGLLDYFLLKEQPKSTSSPSNLSLSSRWPRRR